MPREPRRSSLGTRRGPPRQHIPFRADDLARGKRTGIAVQYVDRNSDEFEPFDELMKQTDNRTPPRIKVKRKRVSIVTPLEVDEDGEMSMELAESNQGSPLAYFATANPAYLLNSARRSSTSRFMPRTSAVDYDEIPSPRRPPSLPSARASMTNGAGPSYLAKAYNALGRDHDFELPDPGNDYPPPDLDADDSPPAQPADEGDGDAMEVEEELVVVPSKVDKGKRRATLEDDPQPQLHEPDDVARGLAEFENGERDEGDDPPSKKLTRGQRQKPQKPSARPAKRVLPASERSPTPDGVRRSRRHRYKPLEWWRQEKVVYGRRESGMTLVPQIKEIIRIPKEPPRPLGNAGKRWRGSSAPTKSKTRDVQTPVAPGDPEEGWDDDTAPEGVVIDFVSQEKMRRRIVQTAKMFEPKAAANSNWFFQKIFGEGDFIAAGQMLIPPQGKKPSKSTKDNAFVFYVIEGAVSVVIHEASYVVATGGMFLVPRGNTYYIENVCQRNARLFFTQARHVTAAEQDAAEHTSRSAPPVSSHRRRPSDIGDASTSASPKRAKSRR